MVFHHHLVIFLFCPRVLFLDLQASLEHFEKRYKKLWDQDKDAYIRRCASCDVCRARALATTI